MVKLHSAIGIDLGGSRLKAGVVDSRGSVHARKMVVSPIRESYPTLLKRLERIVHELRAESGAGRLGLAVAGLLDRDRRMVLMAPNCPALNGCRLGDDLSQAVGMPVAMDNDANLMALGEGAFGAARGCRHFIAITLGTGVGGAVISEGRLIRGVGGGGGELGHIPISRAGPRCGCGARGCLEAYIGSAGVDRYLARTHPRLMGMGLKRVNKLALAGDREAAAVFAYIGRNLAVALAGFVNLFNPELVVVGGGVAAAGELLFEPLQRELRRRAFEVYLRHLTVKPAELGDWAGVVGAAMMVDKD